MSQIYHSNANNESNSRQILIEVTGVRCPELKRRSNYTIKVPYHRLSTTLQRINSLGGRIVSVKLLSSGFLETESAVIIPPPVPATVTLEEQEEKTVIFPPPQLTATENTNTRKTDQKYRISSRIRQRTISRVARNKLSKMTRRMKKLKTRRSKRKLTAE